MRVLLFSVLLPIVLGSAVPEQDKCVWGPPYWCSHVAHARECRATTHCLQTVWKYQTIKPESTETCTYCELLVNALKDALHDKVTEDKIAMVLANACAAFPDSDARDMCKGIVTEYVPELIQMFDNDVSTDMVCATVGFCSGLEDRWSPLEASNSTYCTDCMKFFKDVQESITSNETLNELEQLLDQTLCKELGGFREMCNDVLKQYLPVALKVLADQIDPDIVCRVFGFCGTDLKHKVIKMKNVFRGTFLQVTLTYRSSEECDVCKDIVGEFNMVLENQTLQERLANTIENMVCEKMGDFCRQEGLAKIIENTVCPEMGDFELQCRHLMQGYAPGLIKMFADKLELDPTLTCEIVGLCSPDKKPVDLVARIKSMFKLRKPKMLTGQVSDEECDICKDVLNQVDEFLRDKTNQDKVKYELENVVCTVFGSFEDECKQLVEEYLPMLFELVVNELDPTTVCESAGLCVVPSLSEVAKVKEPTALVGPGYVKNSIECTVCEDIMKEVDFILQQKETINTTEQFIDKICVRLPTKLLSKQCEAFVAEYGEMVIDLLAQKLLNPKTFCTEIDLCKKATVTKPELKDAKCQLCILFVTELQAIVANISEEDLLKDMKAVCSYIPGNLSATCLKYVTDYGQLVISLLKSKEDPKSLCSLANACNSSSVPYMTKPIPETLPVTTVPSEECKICNTVIVFLKYTLKNNSTKEEVKQALEAVCKELPSAISAPCEAFIQEYGDNLVDYIVSELNATEICTLIKLCKAVKKPVPAVSVVMSPFDTLPLVEIPKDKGETQSSAKCELCDEGLNMLLSYISENATKEEIENEVKSFCTKVPESFQAECKAFIDQYGDQIVNYILQKLDAHSICVKIGLCDKLLSMSAVMSPYDTLPIVQPISAKKETQSSAKCELCDEGLNMLLSYISENATKEEIENEVKSFCTKVPESFQAECKAFIDQYGDQIVNYILQKLDAHSICVKIGLCDKLLSMSAVMSPYDNLPIVQPISAKKGSESSENGVECEACKYIMNYLDKELQNNRTKENIKAMLEGLCSKMPAELTSKCKEFVDEYTDAVINFLVLDLSPDEICEKLQLCPAAVRKLPEPVHIKLFKDVKGLSTVNASPECVICEFVIRELDDILKQNRSMAAVKAALDKVCSVMPDTIRDECTDLVNSYSKLIIDLLVKEADPATICTIIKLCKAQTGPSVTTILHNHLKDTSKPKSSAECILCEFVIKELDNILGNNKSEAEIKIALGKVCSLFPDTIQNECIVFVDKYEGLIIKLLVNEISPTKICTVLGLCSSQSQWGTLVKLLPEKSKGGAECELCKFLVENIQQYLKKNGTKEELETFLKKLCDEFPDTVTAQCHDVVDMYVPAFLDLIEKNLKPQEICQQVGLCSNATVTHKDEKLLFKHHKLVGENKCTYGPAYWCANKDNAMECNAIEHCMRHVWN